jgi:hypothetical protein
MKKMWLRIGAILLVTAAIYVFLPTAPQGFKPFDNVIFPIDDTLVSTDGDMANVVSYVLWEKRSLDVILLGLLLFLASACCAAMLGGQGDTRR